MVTPKNKNLNKKDNLYSSDPVPIFNLKMRKFQSMTKIWMMIQKLKDKISNKKILTQQFKI